jgi:hypothetical protein
MLRAGAPLLFGVLQPLAASSTESVDHATAEADPTSLATVAKGLHVRVVTSDPNAGANIDMIAFWPDDSNPSHLIFCNEMDDPIPPAADPAVGQNLRAQAAALKLTGYYRPEDLEVDPGTLAEATANTATPEVQYFVIGTSELAMDNMAFQPGRGNWILHEDGAGPDVGRNNDLWACLEDGEDDDSLSDGCIRVASLNDLTAEWTGGIFDATGRDF